MDSTLESWISVRKAPDWVPSLPNASAKLATGAMLRLRQHARRDPEVGVEERPTAIAPAIDYGTPET